MLVVSQATKIAIASVAVVVVVVVVIVVTALAVIAGVVSSSRSNSSTCNTVQRSHVSCRGNDFNTTVCSCACVCDGGGGEGGGGRRLKRIKLNVRIQCGCFIASNRLLLCRLTFDVSRPLMAPCCVSSGVPADSADPAAPGVWPTLFPPVPTATPWNG